MARALQLARYGGGRVAPNPRVGCVIVYEDRILGEGYHEEFGGPHAEINALKSIADRDRHLLPEATVYVTLEPCAHQGKTPPCANRLVQERVKKVVVAMADPHEKVAGKGIAILQAGGITVATGILEKESRAINRPFITYHTAKRPFVTLKWAQSADYFLGKKEVRTPLTGPMAQRITHRWRSEHQAILVGQQTARIDNPRLDTRLWPGPSPLRIVWDPDGTLPTHLHLFDGSQPTWVLTHKKTHKAPNATVHQLPEKDWVQPLQRLLLDHQITSLLVEGGAFTLQAFIEEAWWDAFQVWTAPVKLGEGIPAPGLPGSVAVTSKIGADQLQTGYRA